MSEIYLFERDNQSWRDEVFNDLVKIRASSNLTFEGCVFNGGVTVYVDQDSSNLKFLDSKHTVFKVGYFEEAGILDGLLIDGGIGSIFQVFYADDVPDPFARRTKNLIWRNLEAYNIPSSPFIPLLADNPIIENNVSVGAHGEYCNAFQINNCLSPVIRGNVAGNTNSTTDGDGVGIIIDWWHKYDDPCCIDALVENNLVFGSKGEWSSGISNYKGINSVIRKNRLVDNTIGIRFNERSDYHAYNNKMLNNGVDVEFSNGATDEGYSH